MMMQKYCVADYSNANEFLVLFAKRLGKLKKGGVPDTQASAKVLLQDWNRYFILWLMKILTFLEIVLLHFWYLFFSGKITFYTHPPVDLPNAEHSSSTIAQYWGAGFDLVKFSF